MIFNTAIVAKGGGGSAGLPEFTYTGSYESCMDKQGRWKLYFLTSGTFTPLEDMIIDAFLVGGGGGGGGGGVDTGYPSFCTSGGGGGGGYGKTITAIQLTANTPYTITIGAGGSGGASVSYGTANSGSIGGTTTAFNQTAVGGNGGGGGRYNGSSGTNGSGGSGQSNGGAGNNSGANATLREFGDADGILYSAGGSGGTQYGYGNESAEIRGGLGGTNSASHGYPLINGYGFVMYPDVSPGAAPSNTSLRYNTGTGGSGYGGGGAGCHGRGNQGGAGAAGIVVVRQHKEEE